MYVENYNRSNEATAQERRAAGQTPDRLIGQVSRCDGSTAVITGIYADPEHAAHLTVGKLISVNLGTIRTVGLVYAVEQAPFATEGGALSVSVSVEFLGEVRDNGTGVIFDRGITEYPFIGAPAHRIRASDLRAIYDLGGKHAIRIGSLSQDGMIDATVAVDEMLSRHFAVVGTTGVGKSTAVSLLLRKIVEARPDLSVLIFDPHNEFGVPLADHCVRLNLKTLSLPFWLFRLDELTEVLYRGHAAPPEELELLRDIIVHAKLAHRDPGGVLRRWIDDMQHRYPGRIRESASPSGNSAVFKNWAYRQYQAPTVTYEVGDRTSRAQLHELATFAADSSYCVQSCSFGTAPLTEDKCASRAELSCQPLLLEGGPSCDDQPCPEPLVCLDGTCSILPACLPRCNSDSDCPADRYCDPRYGECVTERPDGKLPGETCDPNAAEDECRGNCVDFGGGIVECDENCTVGAPGGCGYADAATAPVACAFFAYDFGVDQGISDEGSCAARCRCNDECPGEQLCLPDTSGDAGLCVGGLALEDSLQECPEG